MSFNDVITFSKNEVKNQKDSAGLAHGPWEYGYEIMNLHDYKPCGNALHLDYFVHGQREGENIDVENKY